MVSVNMPNAQVQSLGSLVKAANLAVEKIGRGVSKVIIRKLDYGSRVHVDRSGYVAVLERFAVPGNEYFAQSRRGDSAWGKTPAGALSKLDRLMRSRERA